MQTNQKGARLAASGGSRSVSSKERLLGTHPTLPYPYPTHTLHGPREIAITECTAQTVLTHGNTKFVQEHENDPASVAIVAALPPTQSARRAFATANAHRSISSFIHRFLHSLPNAPTHSGGYRCGPTATVNPGCWVGAQDGRLRHPKDRIVLLLVARTWRCTTSAPGGSPETDLQTACSSLSQGLGPGRFVWGVTSVCAKGLGLLHGLEPGGTTHAAPLVMPWQLFIDT